MTWKTIGSSLTKKYVEQFGKPRGRETEEEFKQRKKSARKAVVRMEAETEEECAERIKKASLVSCSGALEPE